MTSDRPARPPLDRALLTGPAASLPAGVVVEVIDTTASTNAVVAERARAGDPAGLVVVAEHQSAGRGRLDRRWEAPARSSLTFSVLLRPTVEPASWPWLPLLTGYAVARALRQRGYAAGVKWPNDVLVRERKLAGILVERVDSPAGPAAVVGIGLNVDLTVEELPVETATSLAIEAAAIEAAATGAGAVPDRAELLVALLGSLVDTYADWEGGGAAGATRWAERYTQACVTLGRRVRVELPDGSTLTGVASAVDPHGRLVVTGESGHTTVGAGDVVHVRTAPQ